ncbi:hypothetical protein ACSTS3_18955 [Aquimarina muelleri]|uniref:hypothetical protein n=1 Tax=Aquimarina muelleri TaxID=279356 RepID=UPI003F68521A
MKKIPVLLAICAISLSSTIASAQQAEEVLPITKTEATTNQEDYEEFPTDKLSEIIKAAVEKDFPGATISEAYTDKTGNYKLVLTMDNSTKTAYTNSRGEWFTPKK